MFIADWTAALVTFACVALVYKMIDVRSLNINWGSSGQAFTYQQALKYTVRLAGVDDHVKNFRPQILCLSGPPDARPELVSLGKPDIRGWTGPRTVQGSPGKREYDS